MPIEDFTQIIAWQKAHELALFTYRLTAAFPKTEQFGLTSQLRRSAISVSANIAEGFKRRGRNDKRHFYTIAAGSLEELRAEFLLARDLGYLPKQQNEIFTFIEKAARLLNRWYQNC